MGWRVLLPERGRLTIDPGQRAAARASGRRVGAVPCPGAQREERAPPESSQLAARRAGRKEGTGTPAGAGRARAFVCGEGAGTRYARSSAIRPAPPSPPRRVSAPGALSEHYKRGAPPSRTQPIGPPLCERARIGQRARPSAAHPTLGPARWGAADR